MRVLVVEDDLDIQAAVQKRFEDEGFGVDVAANREDAEFAADINEYDVLVLDRTVPGGDMLGFLERRRATGDATPALFLTARDSVQDRVDGFTGGGDDYLVKPFAMDELVVRVRALARRREVTQAPILELGDLLAKLGHVAGLGLDFGDLVQLGLALKMRFKEK